MVAIKDDFDVAGAAIIGVEQDKYGSEYLVIQKDGTRWKLVPVYDRISEVTNFEARPVR